MKQLWTALAGVGFLVCAGCPIGEEMGDPEATIYGRFKADVVLNSKSTDSVPGTVSGGDFMQAVNDVAGGGDGTFAITGRETRLGAKLAMGEALTGVIEMDFYAGATDNKPNPLMRKMFVRMDIGGGMGLTLGQTGDVFSPLLPAVLNYGWGWNCGNVGYRRPQLALDYANDAGIVAQVAAARSITAEAAERPDIQFRVGYKKEKLAAGVSFVSGYTDAAMTADMSGMAIDFNVPIGESMVVRGEYFTGDNLGAYLGGVGTGDVDTSGLWLQFGVKLSDTLKLNVGFMQDDPEATVANTVDHNQCVFVNVRSAVNEKTEAGLEISSWDTDYLGDTEYDNLRIQASVIVNF